MIWICLRSFCFYEHKKGECKGRYEKTYGPTDCHKFERIRKADFNYFSLHISGNISHQFNFSNFKSSNITVIGINDKNIICISDASSLNSLKIQNVLLKTANNISVNNLTTTNSDIDTKHNIFCIDLYSDPYSLLHSNAKTSSHYTHIINMDSKFKGTPLVSKPHIEIHKKTNISYDGTVVTISNANACNSFNVSDYIVFRVYEAKIEFLNSSGKINTYVKLHKAKAYFNQNSTSTFIDTIDSEIFSNYSNLFFNSIIDSSLHFNGVNFSFNGSQLYNAFIFAENNTEGSFIISEHSVVRIVRGFLKINSIQTINIATMVIECDPSASSSFPLAIHEGISLVIDRVVIMPNDIKIYFDKGKLPKINIHHLIESNKATLTLLKANSDVKIKDVFGSPQVLITAPNETNFFITMMWTFGTQIEARDAFKIERDKGLILRPILPSPFSYCFSETGNDDCGFDFPRKMKGLKLIRFERNELYVEVGSTITGVRNKVSINVQDASDVNFTLVLVGPPQSHASFVVRGMRARETEHLVARNALLDFGREDHRFLVKAADFSNVAFVFLKQFRRLRCLEMSVDLASFEAADCSLSPDALVVRECDHLIVGPGRCSPTAVGRAVFDGVRRVRFMPHALENATFPVVIVASPKGIDVTGKVPGCVTIDGRGNEIRFEEDIIEDEDFQIDQNTTDISNISFTNDSIIMTNITNSDTNKNNTIADINDTSVANNTEFSPDSNNKYYQNDKNVTGTNGSNVTTNANLSNNAMTLENMNLTQDQITAKENIPDSSNSSTNTSFIESFYNKTGNADKAKNPDGENL